MQKAKAGTVSVTVLTPVLSFFHCNLDYFIPKSMKKPLLSWPDCPKSERKRQRLSFLAYNMTRAINMVGIKALIEAV